MLENLARPAVIAHRGARAHAPENTLAAFSLAVQQQADAIELDATLSADGHVVIIHDNTVNRTTNGSGKVSRLPLKTLKGLDAGSSYDIAFRGEQIPTLEEVFLTVGKDIIINIELKANLTSIGQLTEQVVKCVKNHNMSDRVFFSSFNIFALRRLAKLLPKVPRGLLTLKGVAGIFSQKKILDLVFCQSLHIHHQDARQSLVNRVQRQERKVFSYTVNHPEDIKRLIALGIDGIFTDDPLRTKRIIADWKS